MRDITSQMAAEFSSAYVTPVVLADLVFDSATLYMWSGIGTLEWQGNSYLGGGNLIGISSIQESQDLQAKGISATLSGIPSSLVATALTERVRGRPFRLWLASASTRRAVDTEGGDSVLTEDGGQVLLENQLLDSPYRIFTGMMDFIELVDSGQTADLRLTIESSMLIGQRAKISRYTDEEQKRRFPNDRGLEFINQLQDKEVVW
jgi:hypothetical protein